ncbi:MAG: ABC transporter permease [Candidatus Latescibacteria bacterium]|nr:ABC transporter permease [Candidatus Latescibacterota bacterium]
MSLLEPVVVGVTQLRANKLRSLLTILGILIGVGSVVGIVSMGEGLRRTVVGEFGKVSGSNLIWVAPPNEWVNKDGRWVRRTWVEHLTIVDVEAIAAESERIAGVLPWTMGGAEVRYRKATTSGQFVGTGPAYLEVFNWQIADGRFLSEKDISLWRTVCVIGAKIRQDLFGAEDPVGREIKINGERYTVVGTMEEKRVFDQDWGHQLMLPISTVQHRITGDRYLQGLQVFVKESGDVDEVVKAIRRALKRLHEHGDDFEVQSVGNVITQIERVIFIMKLVAGGIAGISLLVGGIGIMNIMLVSVTERTREIGIRKAVGARKRHIMAQFIVESVVLSLFGGILGIFVGLGLGFGISSVVTRLANTPFPSVVSPEAMVLSVTFSAVIGVFFGVYPAYRAARMDPVEALRHE